MASKLDDQANRLKALWKSGRDKYASFFRVLQEVRQGIGDDALGDWCFDNLRIPLPVILTRSKVLTKTDAAAARARLKDASARLDEVTRLQNELRYAKERIRDLQQILDAKTREAAALKAANGETPGRPAPKRDRRDYMREFMRKKRAAERSG